MIVGSKLVPNHFITTPPATSDLLNLANAKPAPLFTATAPIDEERIANAVEAALAVRSSVAETSVKSVPSKATIGNSEREAAKKVLAAKLAGQQLARALLTAQSETSGRYENLTKVGVLAAAEKEEVPSASEISAEVATIAASANPVEETSETEADGMPADAITLANLRHRTPKLKPRVSRQQAPAVALKNKDETGNKAPVLAYATPGDPTKDNAGVFSGIGKLFSSSSSGYRRRGIAVYDISAATVHMPDGSKLEAHSGIGHRKDNPKHVHVKNLGPTPPNIYDLKMREKLFHGVEAIRMTPRDVAAMKGRDGMLAHTALLRSGNGSHGCVAFKDYDKFLKAFKSGKVKKMIVVPSMSELPTYMAAL
ncbi:MAG: DUF2778 domain-containing protein [Roseibium sp.]|nr:DUF2778 domain-containing protein [Roseibium sp.]